MEIRMCDDRGGRGFSWIVDEPMTRTSHALAVDGHVWLVDPVRYPPALERAAGLGAPRADGAGCRRDRPGTVVR
jgi:hypothetical protein